LLNGRVTLGSAKAQHVRFDAAHGMAETVKHARPRSKTTGLCLEMMWYITSLKYDSPSALVKAEQVIDDRIREE
jgi:hypothetical protein